MWVDVVGLVLVQVDAGRGMTVVFVDGHFGKTWCKRRARDEAHLIRPAATFSPERRRESRGGEKKASRDSTPLKFKYQAKDQIPAEHLPLYAERDDGFVLDVDGADRFGKRPTATDLMLLWTTMK